MFRFASDKTKYLVTRGRLLLMGVGLLALLVGMIGCSVPANVNSDSLSPEPSPTDVLSKTAGTAMASIPTRPGGEILARITRAPDNRFLETLTPIPTVTAIPSVAGIELTETTVALLNETIETEEPTQTSTSLPSHTPTPTEMPTITLTPPLPPFPEVLAPPTISRTIKVPILMYHYVSTPPEDAAERVFPENPPPRLSWPVRIPARHHGRK